MRPSSGGCTGRRSGESDKTLAPLAFVPGGTNGDPPFTNNWGDFGSSVQMTDAVRRSDHQMFANAVQEYFASLNQMRTDSSFPLEAQRSACSATYHNVMLLHMVSMAEIAAEQGYDLYGMKVDGKSLDTAIAFMLDAFANPALLNQYSKQGGGVCFEGNPGAPADFSTVFNNYVPSVLAWAESYIARFPLSNTASRLRKIIGTNITQMPFPLWHSYSGLNTSCAFRKPYEFKPLDAVKVSVQGGSGQRAAPNQKLGSPLSVKVTDSAGNALSGALVSFAVTQGSANVSAPAQTLTDATGSASAEVTMGPVSGPVSVTATALGSAVSFTVSSSGPSIEAGGLAGVGGSVPPVTAITPGSLFSIYGQNFTAPGTGRRVLSSELVNGVLPNMLLGVCVSVNGLPAPMLDVYPSQINAVVPRVTPGTTVQVSVTTGCNTAAALQSMPQFVSVLAAAPEFLYYQLNAKGHNPVAAVNAVTGGLVWLAGGFAAAHPGDYITIFGAGFGPTSPAIAPGAVSSGVAPATGTVTVTLGGVTLRAADVLYAGAAPGLLVSQLNIRIPSNIPPGDQPLRIQVNGVLSPAGAFLAVANR